jgi:hypothetical protein
MTWWELLLLAWGGAIVMILLLWVSFVGVARQPDRHDVLPTDDGRCAGGDMPGRHRHADESADDWWMSACHVGTCRCALCVDRRFLDELGEITERAMTGRVKRATS